MKAHNLFSLSAVIVCFCLFSFNLQAQNTFVRNISTSSGKLQIQRVVRLPDGGFMMAGYVYSAGLDSTLGLIARTDSNLNFIWTKTLRMMKRDDLSCITALADGNFLVGGTGREDFAANKGGTVIKIDTSGTLIWSRLYSASYDDRTVAIFENADNSLIIFIRNGVSGQPTKILKADNAGAILNKFTLQRGSQNLFGEAFAADAYGNYYITGGIRNAAEKQVIFVAKLSDAGAIWYKEYDFGRNTQEGSGIAVLEDGSVAVSAIFVNASVSTNYDLMVMRIDTAGTLLWSRSLDNAAIQNHFAVGVIATKDTGMVIYGVNSSGSNRASLAKFNSSGNLQWDNEYTSGTGSIYMNHLLEFPDGRLLLTGSAGNNTSTDIIVESGNGQSQCNTLFSDLIPSIPTATVSSYSLTSNPVTISNPDFPPVESAYTAISNDGCTPVGMMIHSEALALEIFPNPVFKTLYVQAPGIFGKADLTIYDIAGRQVYFESIGQVTHFLNIDVQHLHNGTYLVFLESAGKKYVGMFVMSAYD